MRLVQSVGVSPACALAPQHVLDHGGQNSLWSARVWKRLPQGGLTPELLCTACARVHRYEYAHTHRSVSCGFLCYVYCNYNCYFLNKYVLIWLYPVLVVAHEIFFSCSMWDLVPWTEIKPGPPALGTWSLSHWTTREVPVIKLFK